VTQLQFLNDWIQDAVFIGFLSAALFPLVGIYFPWWRHAFGWNLIAFDFAVAVALFPAFLHRVFGVPVAGLFYIYVVAVALTLVPIIVVWRAHVLYQEQKRGAEEVARQRLIRQSQQEDKDSQREA
jgi:heme exporter protein D